LVPEFNMLGFGAGNISIACCVKAYEADDRRVQ
jgi:hypothetical protein